MDVTGPARMRKDATPSTRPYLLAVPEAARLLAISPHTLRQWISRRQIEVVRLGRAVRIHRNEIERLIAERTEPPAKIWREQRW